jgi:hypothetical protein
VDHIPDVVKARTTRDICIERLSYPLRCCDENMNVDAAHSGREVKNRMMTEAVCPVSCTPLFNTRSILGPGKDAIKLVV